MCTWTYTQKCTYIHEDRYEHRYAYYLQLPPPHKINADQLMHMKNALYLHYQIFSQLELFVLKDIKLKTMQIYFKE